MPGKEALVRANREKTDEFYTQLEDIERELRHYRDQFEGKVVFCNCDDPYESNFFKYFAMNFNHLGLKKLITTCYTGSPITGTQLSLFDVDGLAPGPTEPRAAYKGRHRSGGRLCGNVPRSTLRGHSRARGDLHQVLDDFIERSASIEYVGAALPQERLHLGDVCQDLASI